MRVAILHYHLKRGGVTRVIGSALEALGAAAEPIDTVVLAGEVPPGLYFADRCREVPGLRYSNAQTTTPRPEELLAALRSAAHSDLGGPPGRLVHPQPFARQKQQHARGRSSLAKSVMPPAANA
jgi:hypothetical protein